MESIDRSISVLMSHLISLVASIGLSFDAVFVCCIDLSGEEWKNAKTNIFRLLYQRAKMLTNLLLRLCFSPSLGVFICSKFPTVDSFLYIYLKAKRCLVVFRIARTPFSVNASCFFVIFALEREKEREREKDRSEAGKKQKNRKRTMIVPSRHIWDVRFIRRSPSYTRFSSGTTALALHSFIWCIRTRKWTNSSTWGVFSAVPAREREREKRYRDKSTANLLSDF